MIRKKDMSELTFCIPVRIDSEYRMRNLYAMLGFYSRRIRTNYLLTEADSVRRIHSLPDIPGLHYRYIRDDNPIFHRTHYINRMFAETSTRAAAVWDVDAIVPVSQLYQAYRAVMQEENILVYPYDGRFWEINDFYSSLFSKHLTTDILTSMDIPKNLMAGFHSVGGAFLVDVQAYKKMGWENEHFAGWGPEDTERYNRLQILGEKPVRIDGAMYHLYHTRDINSGSYDPLLALETKKEYVHVCSLMPDELKEYIRTWDWIK